MTSGARALDRDATGSLRLVTVAGAGAAWLLLPLEPLPLPDPLPELW